MDWQLIYLYNNFIIPMLFAIYDYVNAQGKNEFKEWTEELQKAQRARLNEKLDKLEKHGDELFPNILTGTGTAGILKLRVKGNVQLRPLLCKGPVDVSSEYTLLMGAKEIGEKWAPKDAPNRANDKKGEVVADPDRRRIKHERVS